MAVFTKSPLLSQIKALLLFSILFRDVCALLTSVDCRWPDGTDSNGRIPCNPDAERSACCLGSEVCLENNLCFGGIGLFYRSACAGGWGDSEICPDFCNDLLRKSFPSFPPINERRPEDADANILPLDVADTWANIWPCPGQGNEGPTQFWCGNGKVCDTSVSGNSSFFAIDNYKFQANSIIGGPAAATTTGATATASLTTGTSTASPTTCSKSDEKQALVVGAGVGVPLALLALALGIWAVVERRKRIHSVGNAAYTGMNNDLHGPPAGVLGRRAEKVELVRNHTQDPAFHYTHIPKS